MSVGPEVEKRRCRTTLGRVLSGVLLVALLMGAGPGILLVNRPTLILGLPAIYFWGLVWYVVELTVVVLAYLFVWQDSEDDSVTDCTTQPGPS